jgi:hypothetical protein
LKTRCTTDFLMLTIGRIVGMCGIALNAMTDSDGPGSSVARRRQGALCGRHRAAGRRLGDGRRSGRIRRDGRIRILALDSRRRVCDGRTGSDRRNRNQFSSGDHAFDGGSLRDRQRSCEPGGSEKSPIRPG